MGEPAENKKTENGAQERRRQALYTTLLKIIDEHYIGPDKKELALKWLQELSAAYLSFFISDPVLENASEGRASLTRLEKKLQKVVEEFGNLGPLADLYLEAEVEKCGFPGMKARVESFCCCAATARQKLEEDQANLKEAGIKKSHSDLQPLDDLLTCLLKAYPEITGREVGFSFDRKTKEPSGPLFNFIYPFVKIFEPNINKITLQDRARKVYRQQQKLEEIQQ